MCQFLLKMMSCSGCLSSVVLATSATIFHPSASLALYTLLCGLAGSITNGCLRGKTQHFSPVSCRKRHWHYSYDWDCFWSRSPCSLSNLSLFLLNVLLGMSTEWWYCLHVWLSVCLPPAVYLLVKWNLSVAVSQALKLCIFNQLTDKLTVYFSYCLSIYTVFAWLSLSTCL